MKKKKKGLEGILRISFSTMARLDGKSKVVLLRAASNGGQVHDVASDAASRQLVGRVLGALAVEVAKVVARLLDNDPAQEAKLGEASLGE